MNLIEIQKQQITWSEKNFGKQHERYPLMGIIEELLEFDEAWKLKEEAAAARSYALAAKADADAGNGPVDLRLLKEISDADFENLLAEVVDALGDIGIYMLDYCGKRGQQLDSVWRERDFLDARTRTNWYDLAPLARRLAHHQLKGEQGIRGTLEEHNREIDRTLRAIMAHLEFICRHLQLDYLEILNGVWAKVSKRDWTKNKVDAHKVAEQS